MTWTNGIVGASRRSPGITFIRSALCLAALSAAPAAWARPIQIIHTNDLHSILEPSPGDHRGGYAAVKATIDSIKAEAIDRKLETLVFDAGDFLEGSPFFLSDRGRDSFRMMNAMGYDAVTIGNHDWLSGPAELDAMVGAARPTFAFLGANYLYTGKRRNLRRYLKPYAIFNKAGLRIAVIGLTTDSAYYSWLSGDGILYDPIRTAVEDLPALRERADVVIALTHLGVADDIRLIHQTSGIDLIVGGHSHTEMYQPRYATDRRGRRIPIVQAGDHGRWVGDLVVDLEPGKAVEIIEYDLRPIDGAAGAKDAAVAAEVEQIHERLDSQYGGAEWMHEVIGHTEVELKRPGMDSSPWGDFMADTLREAAGTQVAIDLAEFHGASRPPGNITREDLFALYPRIFEFDNPRGWNVWKGRSSGLVLRKAVEYAVSNRQGLALSGLTYDVAVHRNGSRSATNIRVGGNPIRWYKRYSVAIPEGAARGLRGISKALSLVFAGGEDTGIPIWQALETRLRRVREIGPTRR